MEFRMGEQAMFWTLTIIAVIVGALLGWLVFVPVLDWLLRAVGLAQ